jgi:hypothetical protein
LHLGLLVADAPSLQPDRMNRVPGPTAVATPYRHRRFVQFARLTELDREQSPWCRLGGEGCLPTSLLGILVITYWCSP